MMDWIIALANYGIGLIFSYFSTKKYVKIPRKRHDHEVLPSWGTDRMRDGDRDKNI